MRHMFSISVIVLIFILTACHGSNEYSANRTPTESTLTERIQPAITKTNSSIVDSTKIQETTILVDGTSMPVFLYIVGNKIFEQAGNHLLGEIMVLPEAGNILYSIISGEIVLVLREQGIQRANLYNKTVDMIFPFDKSAQSGNMLLAPYSSKTFFSFIENNPTGAFGRVTRIGIYDLNQNVVKQIADFPQSMWLLGLTQDNDGAYLLPVGQDPDFGMMYLFDIQAKKIDQELSIQGTGYASLSPDANFLIFAAFHQANDNRLEPSLNLYDLSYQPISPPRTFLLPDTLSQVRGFLWSPNSRNLYFLFLPADITYQPETIDGLWKLSIESGGMSQVASVNDPGYHTISISSQGNWILLKHESKNEAILIDVPSGDEYQINIPANAIFVGWQ